MRAIKKGHGSVAGMEIKLSACDPLNLSGVILPGPRVRPCRAVSSCSGTACPCACSRQKDSVRRMEIVPLARGASVGG